MQFPPWDVQNLRGTSKIENVPLRTGEQGCRLPLGGWRNHRYIGSGQKVYSNYYSWGVLSLKGLNHHKIYEYVGKGFRPRGIVLTSPIPPKAYRLDLDVTFIWVSGRGKKTCLQGRVINKADSKPYDMPQSKDPGAKVICSKDEKTEHPLLVPIWVKLDINHPLKRCCGCLWLWGLKTFPNIISLILERARQAAPSVSLNR